MSKYYRWPASSSGGSGSDEKVKISSNDTTAGYLGAKLIAGTGIILTENNSGANETLTASSDVETLKALLLNSIVTHTNEAPLVRDNSPIDTIFVTIANDGDVVFT